jgi:hypothetical protein
VHRVASWDGPPTLQPWRQHCLQQRRQHDGVIPKVAGPQDPCILYFSVSVPSLVQSYVYFLLHSFLFQQIEVFYILSAAMRMVEDD